MRLVENCIVGLNIASRSLVGRYGERLIRSHWSTELLCGVNHNSYLFKIIYLLDLSLQAVTVLLNFGPQDNDVDGQKLLERGAELMNQTKTMNRVWTKDGQSNKKRKFIKPNEME